MTTADATAHALPRVWLRNLPFDLCFIFLIPALAIAGGSLMAMDASKYITIAYINTSLIAQPHFMATFTRLAFDRATARKNWFLLGPLPLMVIAGVALADYVMGDWFIIAVYFYWQWWHYLRQSYGISRMYLVGAKGYTPHRLYDQYALYVLPLAGILYRSWQQPETFLGFAIRTLPVPYPVVLAVGALGLVLIGMQCLHWRAAYRRKLIPPTYLMYVATHYLVFATGYMLIDSVNFGWLVLSIWHSMQYMVFVWLYNNRRFSAGPDPQEPFMSGLSQARISMVLLYVGLLVFLSMALHSASAIIAFNMKPYTILPGMMIITMSINFHHYIVDAIIWKRKRRTVYA